MERWVGKVAVVTGASAGIGAATVRALAQKGIIVVALARREHKLKEVTDACKGTVFPKVCDLTKEEDIVNTFKWIEKTLGGVDILINNAGVLNPSTLTGGTAADWKGIWETNVLALSFSTREAIKTMRTRGDNGHIVHINSVAGHTVLPVSMIAMYTASKYAVTSLTESLRLELQKLGSNIKITSISPGSVDTDMVRNFRADERTVAEPLVGTMLAALDVEDITDAIIYCLGTRPIVQVHELTIQAVGQKYSD